MFAVGSFSQEPFGFQDGLIKGDPATMSANLTLTANSTRIRLAAMTVSGIASIEHDRQDKFSKKRLLIRYTQRLG